MAEEHHDPKAVEEVKKATAADKKRAKESVRTRRHVREEDERNVVEHGQAVHSVTINPDDMEAVQADLVAGADDIDDEGDLAFHPEHFEGVSPDRLFKASNSHGYPVTTEEDLDKAEEERKVIDEANKAREKDRKAHAEAEEKAARQRLTDFLK
jgi:hypothetical protein